MAGPNAVTWWIESAVEECLKQRNRSLPTIEGVARLAQVIHRGDDGSVRLSDGHCSISAHLTDDVQASLVADSFSLGCIVKVRGWSVTTHTNVSRLTTTANAATTTTIAPHQHASKATGDGLCLWITQRLEIIGCRGLAKVGDPTEIHSSIPIRRILMSLQYNWDDIRERLKSHSEGGDEEERATMNATFDIDQATSMSPETTSQRPIPLGNTAAFLGFDGGNSNIPAAKTTEEVQDLFNQVLAAAEEDKIKEAEQLEKQAHEQYQQRLWQSQEESQPESQLSQEDNDDGQNLGISAMLDPWVASDNEDDTPMESNQPTSQPSGYEHSQVPFETQELMEDPVMEEDPTFETQQPVCLPESLSERQPQSQESSVQGAEDVEDTNQFQSQAVYEAASSVPEEPEFFTQNMDLLETNTNQQFAEGETNTPEKDTGVASTGRDSTHSMHTGETNDVHSNNRLPDDVASKSPLRYPLESGLVTHRRGSTGGLPSRFPRIPDRRGSVVGVESVHDLNLDITLGTLPAKQKKRSWSNVQGSGIDRLLSKCGFYPVKKLCVDLPCLPGDRIRKMLDA